MPMHSYQAGTSLANAGLLDKYYTTVYNNNTVVYQVMEKVLPSHIAKRVTGKKSSAITKYVKKFCELEGLIFVGGGYLPVIKHHTLEVLKDLNQRFGKKVGRDLIYRKTPIVIAYDTYAEPLFSYLLSKKADVVKVLDMASASSKTIAQIIARECEKDYPFLDSMEGKKKVYSEKNVEANMHEIQMADYLLAGSEFVINTLVESGVKREKIFLVPYGIDINKFKYTERKIKRTETLEFLFVGRVEAAKGIWYLLEAFNDKRIVERNVHLTVIGDIRTNIINLEKYPNVSFEGLKQPSEMPQYYQQCDVYISPSLWEGGPFSLLEAMASGLPSVATNDSSGPEVITNGREGFVIESASIERIVDTVIWFDKNREEIPSMSDNARKRIEENYTEDKYYKRLSDAINSIASSETLYV